MTNALTAELTRERQLAAAEAIRRHLGKHGCPDEDLIELVEMEVKELLGHAALEGET